jgi:hypothetical protein
LRVCALGNSHLAALRSGWAACGASYPDLDITWFGAMRDGMTHLRLQNGALRPQRPEVEESFAWTSGGRREVVLADYDAFLLVGMGLSFTLLARLYHANRTMTQSQALPFRRLVSRAVFDAASEGLVTHSLALSLARMIRRTVQVPLLLVADPLPGESAAQGKEAALWQHLARDPDGTALLARFAAQSSEAATRLQAGFVPQPDETRAAPPFTADRLRRGAVRMLAGGDTPFEEEDTGHMGPEYGSQVLAAVARRLMTPLLQTNTTWA